MAENRELKRLYEIPIVLDLGSLAHGTGQVSGQCIGGSGADASGSIPGCKKGSSATCDLTPPSACCQSGAGAKAAGESGNLSGEGQGFDAGTGSGDSGAGEGSGFRTP